MTRTTHMFRALLGLATVAALSTAADAQSPQQDTTARRTTTSGGTVERRPARRPSTRAAVRPGEPRAHPRDYYGADDPRCDDLCARERMMDAKYGKDRERLPAARRTP